jgi:hypothetical protein
VQSLNLRLNRLGDEGGALAARLLNPVPNPIP